MKIKNVLIIILLVFVSIWFFVFANSWDEMNLPIEERAAKTIAYEPFKVVEFEKGYICFSYGSGDDKDCMFLTYLENDLMSSDYLAIRGGIGEKYSYFLNNSDLSKCLVFNLDISSKNTIYFSCCEEKSAMPVIVNGENMELYDVEIEFNGEVHKRKFWFYLGKKNELPKVELTDNR